ncbi:MAG: FtsX-like permease family protein [Flammeovirgaceae bacterium]|nr:FtsX-like permease family protein [Flammeovirgaceae bacterium]
MGNGDEALQNQTGLVLTKDQAQKYFGKENPIGKTVSLQLAETFEDFEVKAVVENVPTNSGIQFTILISDLNFSKLVGDDVLNNAWFNVSPETYVLLKEEADKSSLESKFPALFKTVLGDEDYEMSKYAPGLQPLTEIHLDTAYPAGIAPVSNPKYSYILAAISMLILFVACINFITLSTGRSLKRAKEVGLRKVVGAQRSQLIAQFIGEASIVTLIALLVGLMLSFFALPLFNDLSGKLLAFPFDTSLLMISVVLLFIIGLIAGSYPAFVLSAFKPVVVLKGSIQKGRQKQGVRKFLVGTQLVLSIFLISSTLVMQRQLSFLQNKNLGFNKDQVLVVPLPTSRQGRLPERIASGFELSQQFKNELKGVSGIKSICVSAHDFATGAWTAVGYTDEGDTYRNFNLNIVDADYISSMNMEMVLGRNFAEENLSDKRRSIIVNEAFAREYSWENALGKKIPGKNFGDHEVIGVVKDFHFASLYSAIQPLVLVLDAGIILQGVENIGIQSSPYPKLLIHLEAGSITAGLDKTKEVWNRITGGEEFQFSFVDEAINAQYRSDQNLGKIMQLATVLAILIGSLGLYALAALAMESRTKEISIRKVMGATEKSLLILLSKEYVLLVIVALVISVPATFYLMGEWLKSFEYRVSIGLSIFLLSGVAALVIALLAISYQTLKVAWTQPAETLKYE